MVLKTCNHIAPKFDFTGPQLAEAGLAVAVESAEKKEKEWSKTCWQLFLVWLRYKKRGFEFQVEDFRKHVKDYGLLEDPPSNRAFGLIGQRGSREGWITQVGTRKVKNPKAHAANANVWRKL